MFKKRVFLLFLAGGVLLLFPFQLTGQLKELTVDAIIGFNGHFQPGRLTPLHLILQNQGSRIIGTLKLRIPGARTFVKTKDMVFTREIEVAGGTTRYYSLIIPILNLSQPLELTIEARQGEFSRTIHLESAWLTENMSLVLGRGQPLRYLYELNRKHPFTQTNINLLHVHPDFLPDHWAGYDGVQVIFLYGNILASLPNHKWDTLVQWVSLGGTLFIPGGAAMTAGAFGRLSSLLNSSYLGRRLETEGGQSYIFIDTRFPRGRIVQGDPERPLAVTQRFGSGRIFFTAYDPDKGLNQANDPLLWKQVFVPRHPLVWDNNSATEMILTDLARLPVGGFPSRILGMVIIFLYLILLYLLYRFRTTISGFLLKSLAIALLFITAIVVYPGFFPRSNYRLSTQFAAYELLPDSDRAIIRHSLLLGGAKPEQLTYNLSRVATYVIPESNGMALGEDYVDVPVVPWHNQRVNSVTALQFGISSHATSRQDYVEITITTQIPVYQAFFVHAKGITSLGDMDGGLAVSKKFPRQSSNGIREITPGFYSQLSSDFYKIATRNMINHLTASQILFLGFIRQDPILAPRQQTYYHQNYSMVFRIFETGNAN